MDDVRIFELGNVPLLNGEVLRDAKLAYQTYGTLSAKCDNAVLLPSFVRFDAAAYYNIDETSRIQLNIENLLDTEYYPHSHRNSNITVGAPINATVSYTKTF